MSFWDYVNPVPKFGASMNPFGEGTNPITGALRLGQRVNDLTKFTVYPDNPQNPLQPPPQQLPQDNSFAGSVLQGMQGPAGMTQPPAQQPVTPSQQPLTASPLAGPAGMTEPPMGIGPMSATDPSEPAVQAQAQYAEPQPDPMADDSPFRRSRFSHLMRGVGMGLMAGGSPSDQIGQGFMRGAMGLQSADTSNWLRQQPNGEAAASYLDASGDAQGAMAMFQAANKPQAAAGGATMAQYREWAAQQPEGADNSFEAFLAMKQRLSAQAAGPQLMQVSDGKGGTMWVQGYPNMGGAAQAQPGPAKRVTSEQAFKGLSSGELQPANEQVAAVLQKGKTSQDHILYVADGKIHAEPAFGSKAYYDRRDRMYGDELRPQNRAFERARVVGSLGKVLSRLDEGNVSDSAFWQNVNKLPGIGAAARTFSSGEVGEMTSQIKEAEALIAFGQLQAMRNESPTGGALGQVSNFEVGLLKAVYGELDPSRPAEEFREAVVRAHNLHLEMVHGVGNADHLLEPSELEAKMIGSIKEKTGKDVGMPEIKRMLGEAVNRPSEWDNIQKRLGLSTNDIKELRRQEAERSELYGVQRIDSKYQPRKDT